MAKTSPPKPQPVAAERTSLGSQFGPPAFSSLKKCSFLQEISFFGEALVGEYVQYICQPVSGAN